MCIKSDQDHDKALREIERLWNAPAGTPKRGRLEVLIALVDAYENMRYPMEPPDPADGIRVRLEQ